MLSKLIEECAELDSDPEIRLLAEAFRATEKAIGGVLHK